MTPLNRRGFVVAAAAAVAVGPESVAAGDVVGDNDAYAFLEGNAP